jgi:hypothetical protein
LALTLYLYVLIAHWVALLAAGKEPESVPEPVPRTEAGG